VTAELTRADKKNLAIKSAVALVRQCKATFKGETIQTDRPGKAYNAIGFASKHAAGWLVVDYENGGTNEEAKRLIEIFQSEPGPYPYRTKR
jgi:hypothetical protein